MPVVLQPWQILVAESGILIPLPRLSSRLYSFFGPRAKARIKRSRRLDEPSDRLAGWLSRRRHAD